MADLRWVVGETPIFDFGPVQRANPAPPPEFNTVDISAPPAVLHFMVKRWRGDEDADAAITGVVGAGIYVDNGPGGLGHVDIRECTVAADLEPGSYDFALRLIESDGTVTDIAKGKAVLELGAVRATG